MAIESRIKAILKSAELSFELGIINATRFGPIIHANVPDYAEILLRVFVEENHINPTQSDFPGLVTAVSGNLRENRSLDQQKFQHLGNYFVDTRHTFRNPIHHTDRVQGYVIERSEALLCLINFNELLFCLFPTISMKVFEGLNFPCYIQFIKLEYNQNLGINNRLYQAVISAVHRIEGENAYQCPDDFDSSRLIAIRQLYHFDSDTFTRNVFNYRPQIKNLVVDELHQATIPLSSNQLLPRLKSLPSNEGLTSDEIERCLGFLEGEKIDGYGIVTAHRTRTLAGNPIIRYNLLA